LGGLIKKVDGLGQSKVPFFSKIPVLGELLFTHNSDVERQQNVIIYLTPYIVRSSGDLQKLKELLSELDKVQDEYNRLVKKKLEERKGGVFSSQGSASGRIRRSAEVYRGPIPEATTQSSMGASEPKYVPSPVKEVPSVTKKKSYVSESTSVPKPKVSTSRASSRISSENKTVEAEVAPVEEEGFFSSLFSGTKKSQKVNDSSRGSRGPYHPDFGDE
jgi:hypothetical protein